QTLLTSYDTAVKFSSKRTKSVFDSREVILSACYRFIMRQCVLPCFITNVSTIESSQGRNQIESKKMYQYLILKPNLREFGVGVIVLRDGTLSTCVLDHETVRPPSDSNHQAALQLK
ncbi:hypothetical protein Bpfe_009448, partial [Biomphalaria pfeifferi]